METTDGGGRAMAERAEQEPSAEEWAEAREYVTQRLAAISSIIWAVGVAGFMILVFPSGNYKISSGMIVGMWALAAAAVPWMAYVPLVHRVAHKRHHDAAARQ